jgi:hypothetical protein
MPCDANGSFIVGLAAGTYTFDVYHPNNDTLLLGSFTKTLPDGDLSLPVTKQGSAQSVTYNCFPDENFSSWSGSFSKGTIKMSDGFYYISGGSDDFYYSTSGYISGATSNTVYPLLIFPIKGEGSDITFKYKTTSNNSDQSIIEFFRVNKVEGSDGSLSFTKGVSAGKASLTCDKNQNTATFTTPASTANDEYIGMTIQYCYLYPTLQGTKTEYTYVGYENYSATVKSDNQPISDLKVTLSNGDTSYTATTGENGVFNFYAVESSCTNIDFGSDFVTGSYVLSSYDPTEYDLTYLTTSVRCNLYLYSNVSFDGSNIDVVLVGVDSKGNETELSVVNTGEGSAQSYWQVNPTIIGDTNKYAEYKVRLKSSGWYVTTGSKEETYADAASLSLPLSNNTQKVYIAERTPLSKSTASKTIKYKEDRQLYNKGFDKIAYIIVSFEGNEGNPIGLIQNYDIKLSKDTASEKGLRMTSTVKEIPLEAEIIPELDEIHLSKKFTADNWDKELESGSYTLYIRANTILLGQYIYDTDISLTIEDIETGVDRVIGAEDSVVDIYTASGVVVKRGVAEDALEQLPAGLYVVNGNGKAYKYLKR